MTTDQLKERIESSIQRYYSRDQVLELLAKLTDKTSKQSTQPRLFE
jgi:hypothetical protein